MIPATVTADAVQEGGFRLRGAGGGLSCVEVEEEEDPLTLTLSPEDGGEGTGLEASLLVAGDLLTGGIVKLMRHGGASVGSFVVGDSGAVVVEDSEAVGAEDCAPSTSRCGSLVFRTGAKSSRLPVSSAEWFDMTRSMRAVRRRKDPSTDSGSSSSSRRFNRREISPVPTTTMNPLPIHDKSIPAATASPTEDVTRIGVAFQSLRRHGFITVYWTCPLFHFPCPLFHFPFFHFPQRYVIANAGAIPARLESHPSISDRLPCGQTTHATD